MAERIDLATPDQASPGTPTYEPVALLLHWKGGYVELRVEGANGEQAVARWSDDVGEDATALMRALNKANLTTKTLLKRAMERALLDGKLPAGTISGTPD